MTPLSIPGGAITVKNSKDMAIVEIKHPYRFGETLKLTRDQAAELSERLKMEAGKCKSYPCVQE